MLTSQVLVVDDDVILLQTFAQCLPLRNNNLIVRTCHSSLQALDLVEGTDFDAIVVDLKMPGLDGLALLREIREIRPATPVFIITGYYGSYTDAVEALRAGATDFIHKPMDWDHFVMSLQVAIQRYQAMKEREQERLRLEQRVHELAQVIRENGLARYSR